MYTYLDDRIKEYTGILTRMADARHEIGRLEKGLIQAQESMYENKKFRDFLRSMMGKPHRPKIRRLSDEIQAYTEEIGLQLERLASIRDKKDPVETEIQEGISHYLGTLFKYEGTCEEYNRTHNKQVEPTGTEELHVYIQAGVHLQYTENGIEYVPYQDFGLQTQKGFDLKSLPIMTGLLKQKVIGMVETKGRSVKENFFINGTWRKELLFKGIPVKEMQ